MNPTDLARPLGRLASKLTRHLDITATAILTIDGNQIACFFGSGMPFHKECMSELMQRVGDDFTRMSKEIAAGNLQPELMENDQGDVDTQFFHKQWFGPTESAQDTTCQLCGGTGLSSLGKKCLCQY